MSNSRFDPNGTKIRNKKAISYLAEYPINNTEFPISKSNLPLVQTFTDRVDISKVFYNLLKIGFKYL